MLLLVSTPCLVGTFAQDYQAYTQWNLPEGAKARLGKGQIVKLQYSRDGTRLAVATSIGTWLYDAQSYKEHSLLTGHTLEVRRVAFSPDGHMLATGSIDHTIRLWDVATGSHLSTLSGHTNWVTSLAFSPDGQTLASGGGALDETIRLWDVATGRLLRTLSSPTLGVNSVAFDGQTLASGSADGTILLWEIKPQSGQ